MAGAFQHITARGNERKDIFIDKEDRLCYLDLIERAVKKYCFELVAYCLMLDHLHQLARFPDLNMDRAMFFIQWRYAKYFNKRHSRTGHLFERRYNNEVVTTETYLHEAGRYIHMNPVVDRLVLQPEEYVWSSFREYWSEEYRLVSKESPLITCFRPAGAFDAQAFHDFTTARRRAAADPQWYGRPTFAPPPGANPLQEAADRSHPLVKKIIAGVCRSLGYWGDLHDSSDQSHARDSARALVLFLVKEALPAWNFDRIRPLAGIQDRKNVYRIYQRCAVRLAFDPVYKSVVADVREALRRVPA